MARDDRFLFEDETTFQRIGYRVGIDFFEAQDFAQDVRFECWLKTGTVPSFTKPDFYNYQGLVWKGQSRARKIRRLPAPPRLREEESFDCFAEERLPVQFSVEAKASWNEQLALGFRLLSEGLLSLSVSLRDAWILCEIVELDYPEIVTIQGLTAGKKGSATARKRHSRAEQKLIAFFEKHQCTISPCDLARFLLDLQEENAENTE